MRPSLRLAALSVLLLNACYPPGDGKPPPLDEIYFPTGLALDGQARNSDGASRYLYLANSDFDLQYRSSSLIAYDLDKLSAVVPKSCNTDDDCDAASEVCDKLPATVAGAAAPKRVPSYFCVKKFDQNGNTVPYESIDPCGALGVRDDADQVLYPGRCNWIDPVNPQDGSPSLKVASVGIGAFAADLIWRPNCEEIDTVTDDGTETRTTECSNSQAPSRLFVPVRGDSTLHWIDLNPDLNPSVHGGQLFWCNQDNGDEDGCDGAHRAGHTDESTQDKLTQDPEPFAVDATAQGEFIVITNQTTGTVSLFHNEAASDAGPKLVSVATGLPIAPVGVATVPKPTFADSDTAYAPSFLVAYRNAAQIDLLRVRNDGPYPPDSNPAAVHYTRYALRRAGSVPVNANSLNFDQRGIAIDDSAREGDYKACLQDAKCSSSPDCLTTCLRTVRQPSVFVASRAPASMLVGALSTDLNYVSGTSEVPSFSDSIPLSFGPSRVIAGKVRVRADNADGFVLATRIFVVCFDSRRIFVYDPAQNAIESIISTGRGPHAFAVDAERGLAYVAHFTDSYLGVISLDQRFPQTYAAIVASIGAPKAPRSSK